MSMKRPAAAPASSKRANVPTESLCVSVSAELGCAKELSDSVVQMLQHALPFLFVTPEHQYQERVLKMVSDVLQKREAALSSQVTQMAASMEEAACAQDALPTRRTEAKKAVKVLQEKELALSQAQSVMKRAEEEYALKKRELETVPARKQALLAAIRDLYEPLKDGSVHEDAEEGYAQSKLAKLLEMVKSLDFDAALRRSASHGLRNKPSARSAADHSAVRELGDQLNHRAQILEMEEMRMADSSASVAIPTSELDAARTALDHAQQQRDSSASAAREAEEEVQRCTTVGRNAKRARTASDTVAAEFRVFQEGPLAAFHELLKRLPSAAQASSAAASTEQATSASASIEQATPALASTEQDSPALASTEQDTPAPEGEEEKLSSTSASPTKSWEGKSPKKESTPVPQTEVSPLGKQTELVEDASQSPKQRGLPSWEDVSPKKESKPDPQSEPEEGSDLADAGISPPSKRPRLSTPPSSQISRSSTVKSWLGRIVSA